MTSEDIPDDEEEGNGEKATQSNKSLAIQKAIEACMWVLSRLILAAAVLLFSLKLEMPIREFLKGDVLSKFREAELSKLKAEYELLNDLSVAVTTMEIKISDYREASLSVVTTSQAGNGALLERQKVALQSINLQQTRLEDLFGHRSSKFPDPFEHLIYKYISMVRGTAQTLATAQGPTLDPLLQRRLSAKKTAHDILSTQVQDAIQAQIHELKLRSWQKSTTDRK